MLISLSVLWCMLLFPAPFLTLCEYRCSRLQARVSLALFMTAEIALNSFILHRYGMGAAIQWSFLTCSLPAFLFFIMISREQGPRYVFAFCMTGSLTLWVVVVTGFAYRIFGMPEWSAFLLRLIALPLMANLTWRYIRRPWREFMTTTGRDWHLFAANAVLIFLVLQAMCGELTHLQPNFRYAMFHFAISIVLIPLHCTVMFLTLTRQRAAILSQERQDVFRAQVLLLQRRVEDVRKAENRVRIERHDLRHRFQAVAAMVERGEPEEALAYIRASQDVLQDVLPKHYCANPVLDAILGIYLKRAEEQGIAVETRLAIPEELPVNAVELSTVFSNALENAIQACGTQPEEGRRIVCTCVTSPRLIFEIANTCREPVEFDAEGLPAAKAPGHGIGVRSILAFAEQHNALCTFSWEDGWFRVRLAL